MIGLVLTFIIINRLNKSTKNSNITQIDEDNFIVNGELISFEEDTSVLRWKQELEDSKFYLEYEMNRLQRDRKYLGDLYFKVTDFIINYPNCISTKFEHFSKDEIIDSYKEYVNQCHKLDYPLVLTEEEYIVSRNNIIHCFVMMDPLPFGRLYMIHNDKTAKYKDKNSLEEEFGKKWY